MKKGIVPGVVLAVIGVVLFAYEGFGICLQTSPVASGDQAFPMASVLAAYFL
jgi:hypothetical protein